MKTLKFLSFIAIIAFLSQSCLRDTCNATRSYVRYNPVYMTGAELKYDVKTDTDRPLINPGKMYFYKNYIFINEQGKGVHIYNNENPESPEKVTFYSLPGNFDIAIKDDVMYADNPLYIMSIDVSNVLEPNLTARNNKSSYDWYYENDDYQHVIYYTKSNVVETIDCSDNNFNNGVWNRGGNIFIDVAFESADVLTNSSTDLSGSAGNTGVGGSTARFTIVGDYMYSVDEYSLNVWDLNDGKSLERLNTRNIGWGIETIFPYKDKLFIGSAVGMYIFDNSDPTAPIQVSEFRHAAACDPVVVTEDRAYVTLRDGNQCAGFENQLDVIDITNIYNPTLIKSYEMRHPHGLAIRGNTLYICEGDYGLKIFDASDDEKINQNQIGDIINLHAYDVISLSDDLIFIVGEGGFYQYDVTEKSSPALISAIEIQK